MTAAGALHALGVLWALAALTVVGSVAWGGRFRDGRAERQLRRMLAQERRRQDRERPYAAGRVR